MILPATLDSLYLELAQYLPLLDQTRSLYDATCDMSVILLIYAYEQLIVAL